nr:hypothetical protein [Tanacetum cinerariifolium]
LADKAILSGAENHPPMLEKDMPRKYSELTHVEATQDNCDVKATNIILQGLPLEVYTLSQQYPTNQSSTPLSITYPSNNYQSSVHHNVYSPPQSIPQLEYPPAVNLQPQQAEFPQLDSGLTVPVFKQGDDPIDFINHMMSFLSAVVTSRYPTTNNQLRNSLNPRKQATINDERVTLQPIHRRQISFATDHLKTQVVNCTKINLDNKSVDDTLTDELERYKEQVKVLKEGQNVDLKSQDNVLDSCEQSVEIDRLKQTLSEQIKEKESLMKTFTLLKNDFKKEESRNINREIALEKKIKQLNSIVFKRDQSAPTVHMLTKSQFFYDHTTKKALESFKNDFKTKGSNGLEKKVNTTPVDYVVLNQLSQDFDKRFIPQIELSAKQAFWSQNSMNSSDHSPSYRPTKVEVPKELPKVSMAVEQHHLESKTFEIKMNKVLNENERLLEQVITKDIVNIVVNSFVDNASVKIHECKKCLERETKLLNKTDFIKKKTYDKLFRSYMM